MFRFCNLCAILVDFTDMALPPRDQRHQYLMYKGLQYSDADIVDFEARLARIYRREVHRVQVFDFGGLPDLMAEGLSARMLMEHRDAQGVSLFTSRAWRQLFDIRGLLVHELILEFFSTFRFGETILDLDKAGALQFQLGGGFSSVGDFMNSLSTRHIRDLFLGSAQEVADAADGALGVDLDVVGERVAGDVHEIHGALAEQRKVIVAMARYFSRFTVWANSGIAQLLDSARVIYMPYSETRIQSRGAPRIVKEYRRILVEEFNNLALGSVGVLKLQDGCSTRILAQ
ncbi:hypothetical protein Tco_0909813 [Tanacetum coccineum]|uniref:Uncharacterized protein n=1 Tax=Tanacetum coccineum TaxID=301880 RepID=A0ABQ5CT91_9ASTR